jgi:hypothetical protein
MLIALRGVHHRVHDVRVAGTAAQVPGQHVPNLLAARVRDTLQIIVARHEYPGRAKAALQGMMVLERKLKIIEFLATTPIQTLDRLNHTPFSLYRQPKARAHGNAIDLHGTSPAHAMLATHMHPCRTEGVPQEIGQQHA